MYEKITPENVVSALDAPVVKVWPPRSTEPAPAISSTEMSSAKRNVVPSDTDTREVLPMDPKTLSVPLSIVVEPV